MSTKESNLVFPSQREGKIMKKETTEIITTIILLGRMLV
jgi:hypothetical protein